MDFSHAFSKIHAVVFYGGDAYIGAGGQAVVLFGDFGTGGNLAEPKDVLVLAVTELFVEPVGFLGDSDDFVEFREAGVPFFLGFLLALFVGGFYGGFRLCTERFAVFLEFRKYFCNLCGLAENLFELFVFGGVGVGKQGVAVFHKQVFILVRFAAVEPNDGVQVLELPFVPLVQGAVHNGVIVAGVDEQDLVLNLFAFALVKEPKGTRQALGIKEVVAHAYHAIHVSRSHQLFADVLVLALAVCRRSGHHKARAAGFVQVTVEVRNPQVVSVANFLVLVYRREPEGESPGILATFRFYLVNVEGRVRHHIIAFACKVVRIVIEGVRLVAGFYNSGKPMHRHVHLAKLGVVFHLFLAVKGHGFVASHAGGIHKVARLHEHSARSASGVQQYAMRGFQHVHNHLHQGLWRKENAVVTRDVLGKLAEEVFVDATHHVAAHIVEGVVVEGAQKFGKQFVLEIGVGLGQYTFQFFALGFDKFHGVVHDFAKAVERLSVRVLESCRCNICGQVHEVIKLRFFREEQSTLGRKIAGFNRENAATAARAVLENFGFDSLEAAIGVTQEQKPQNRHAILIRRQLGIGTEQVRRFPQIGFKFL